MDWGSRFFWGFMAWVAIDLAWLRFIEAYLPIWVGCIVGLIALAAVMYALKRRFPLVVAKVGQAVPAGEVAGR